MGHYGTWKTITLDPTKAGWRSGNRIREWRMLLVWPSLISLLLSRGRFTRLPSHINIVQYLCGMLVKFTQASALPEYLHVYYWELAWDSCSNWILWKQHLFLLLVQLKSKFSLHATTIVAWCGQGKSGDDAQVRAAGAWTYTVGGLAVVWTNQAILTGCRRH